MVAPPPTASEAPPPASAPAAASEVAPASVAAAPAPEAAATASEAPTAPDANEKPASTEPASLEVATAWATDLAEGAFRLLDADSSGLISINELIESMASLSGDRLGATDAVLLFDALDIDSDGKITIDELREGMIEAGTGNPSVSKLLAVLEQGGFLRAGSADGA